MKKIGYKILFLFILTLGILYFISNKTYTSYESKVDDNISLKIADWKIMLDEQDIVTETKDIILNNIVWDNERTTDGKVAPGSKGVVKIVIDPTTTQVAFKYSLSYVDHTMDPNYILTVNSISLEDGELVKENDAYSGIFTLDEIKSGVKKTLVIEIEWVNNEENNDSDSEIGLGMSETQYLKMNFNASQLKEG